MTVVTPDYRRIHELEFELGFRDDPPPSGAQSLATADSLLKSLWTDAPGRVVAYNPPGGRTEVAWARQPMLQPGEDLKAWVDADIDRRAGERESRSVRG